MILYISGAISRLIIAWINKKLGIASPTLYYMTGQLYEYDKLMAERRNKHGNQSRTVF
ncbi:hypothetical protein KCG48_05000 [Proteiniclasticum sp. BAD-10]|uniref:Uncharacterized protein n=1 Tax=Proteiniclasticum sediminis TaxID=2804028 RepID=A0A941HQP3_9CLOT|nr:hypothetical protein [Proteiniclasticum sediminis]MBR0575698.1 hypothetical protein [Proteiniclasticum sediminis]